MEWFRKGKKGIDTTERRNIPEGLWTKCTSCGEIAYSKKMEQLLWVCPSCSFHFRIPSQKYIELLLDDGYLEEFDADLISLDPLHFKDSKRYPDRIKAAQLKSGAKEGVIAGLGKVAGMAVSFAIMDFSFIGGSMGSVVGEKIARAIATLAIQLHVALVKAGLPGTLGR